MRPLRRRGGREHGGLKAGCAHVRQAGREGAVDGQGLEHTIFVGVKTAAVS